MSKTSQKPSGACPASFQAMCHEAATGQGDYEWAGYHLARLVATLEPNDMESEDWLREVESLGSAVAAQDRDASLAWLDRWLPRCMELVPTDQRIELVAGIDRATDEFDITDP